MRYLLVPFIISVLMLVIAFAGCAPGNDLQGSSVLPNDNSMPNIGQEAENTVSETEELYPGYITIEGVIGSTKAWLEKEEGLTPFSDIEEGRITWLKTPYILAAVF